MHDDDHALNVDYGELVTEAALAYARVAFYLITAPIYVFNRPIHVIMTPIRVFTTPIFVIMIDRSA